MSSIVKCKSGKYTYIYESESYRDGNGNPQNRRKCIGRVDPVTGKDVFNPEYIERAWGTGRQPAVDDTKIFSVNDIKSSSNKELGTHYLLDGIAEKVGLKDSIQAAIPNLWERILHLAYFMVASGEPAMYCEDWLAKTDGIEPAGLTSQKISELLIALDDSDRAGFYEIWGERRGEEELYALDITSISSYSGLIGDVGWGYNRDGENLAQINICMLMGEMSGLPIFQVVYNGALKDVSTLKATLSMTASLNFSGMAIIMDKGFSSKRNIDSMLSDPDGIRFLVSLPFTMKFALSRVESERKDIDTVENTMTVGGDTFRGIMKVRKWDGSHKVFTHVYFNADLAYRNRNRLYGKVARLRKLAASNPDDPKLAGDFKKYLIVRNSTSNESGRTISIRKDAIDKELSTTGWMVAVSNFIDDPEKAISIYRAKDVVEKGFFRLKNCLDLARLRVHSDNAMQNKVFVGFIALILTSHINKVMSEKNLYDAMTMKKMLKIMDTLRVQCVNGKRIVYPPTKTHRSILEAFGLAGPL
jgi:transposase